MTGLLIAAHNFPPATGGIERLADGFARHVAPADTTVLAAPHRDAVDHDRYVSYRVVRMPLVGAVPPRWWRAARTLRGMAGEFDAVLSMEWWPEGRALASIGKRSGGRRVAGPHCTAVVVHGTEVGRALDDNRVRRAAQRSLQAADVVIAVSEYAASLAAELDVQAHVVHPGVDLERPIGDPQAMAERLGVVGRPIVLSAARLVPRKGHADLLRVWDEVEAAVPGVVWLIAGTGPEADSLRRMAPPSVRLLGSVGDENLAALYKLADVHVLPGRVVDGHVEGFGLAAVEAGAAASPTVATAVGGTAEAVGPGGVIVPPERPHAFVSALVDLLRDDSKRLILGRCARAHAESMAWPVVAQRLRGLLGLSVRAEVPA